MDNNYLHPGILLAKTLTLLSFLFNTSCVSIEWHGGMIPAIGLVKVPKPKFIQNTSGSFREIEHGWPQFRGPNRLGTAPAQGVSINWEEKPRTVWTSTAGQGHSSLISDKSLLYTLEQVEGKECLIARAMQSGQEIWRIEKNTQWYDMMSGTGPRATPTLVDGDLYTLFSNGLLARINAKNGKVLWEKKVVSDEYKFPEWGLSCSPLIWNDLIILNLGVEGAAAEAFNKFNGELEWSSDVQGECVYLSPTVLKLFNTEHLIIGIKGKIVGLDPLTGKTKWEKKWKIFLNNAQITQPLLLSNDCILLAAGYGRGAECWKFSQDRDKYEIKTLWTSKNLKAKFSTPVLHEGYIYGLSENLLVCLKAESGNLQWRGKKYGYGRIIRANDKLLILGSTGTLSIVEADPQTFQEVQSFQLLTSSRCWNGPAMVGGYLFARNGEQIACFDFAE